MTPEETLATLAPGLHGLLTELAGHPCRWVLVTFQHNRAYWVSSAPEAGDVLPAFKAWVEIFSDPEHKPQRQGFEDEIAVAQSVREIVQSMEELLTHAGLDSNACALVIFPRDLGLYGANIEREQAVIAMGELLPHLEIAFAHRQN